MKQHWLETLLLPVVAVLVLAADQVSKHLVVTRLEIGQSWDIAPWLAPVFRITPITNTGAAFGMFPRFGNVFVIVAFIVIAVIIAYYRQITRGEWWMRLAFGLALGGAIGNLIDRLRQGYVIDFIDANFWPFQGFPIFNVADSAISVGTALLAILMLRDEIRERRKKQIAESD